MGARPIASLDSLRFGPLDKPRQRYLFELVMAERELLEQTLRGAVKILVDVLSLVNPVAALQ